jgi:DNA modification methylase
MQPYYQRGGITIYLGDCREIVSRLDLPSVDLALLDPPYGVNGASGNVNKQRGKVNYKSGFDDTPEYIAAVVVPVVRSLVAECRSVIVTPGYNNFSLYPQPDSFGCFYQPASVGLQVFGNLDAQPIFYYGKNVTKKNMGVPCSYQLTESPGDIDHPCPKPLGAWTKLLCNFSLPGQLILDPFMGSGTTLVAAQKHGRRAVGIELSEDYCKIAVDRLKEPSFFSIPDQPAKAAMPEQIPLLDLSQ